jgi:hypothetical protein
VKDSNPGNRFSHTERPPRHLVAAGVGFLRRARRRSQMSGATILSYPPDSQLPSVARCDYN